eukprot:sb/3466447/
MLPMGAGLESISRSYPLNCSSLCVGIALATSTSPHKTLIMDPQVTMLGPDSAVIAYVRICQKLDAAGLQIYPECKLHSFGKSRFDFGPPITGTQIYQNPNFIYREDKLPPLFRSFHPDLPGKTVPPIIPVNRGPTVYVSLDPDLSAPSGERVLFVKSGTGVSAKSGFDCTIFGHLTRARQIPERLAIFREYRCRGFPGEMRVSWRHSHLVRSPHQVPMSPMFTNSISRMSYRVPRTTKKFGRGLSDEEVGFPGHALLPVFSASLQLCAHNVFYEGALSRRYRLTNDFDVHLQLIIEMIVNALIGALIRHGITYRFVSNRLISYFGKKGFYTGQICSTPI